MFTVPFILMALGGIAAMIFGRAALLICSIFWLLAGFLAVGVVSFFG